MQTRKRIVVLGGGTGSFVTLYGLKHYPVDLTAIVTMTDSGGSTGKLRDQYGVLPPGDVRQALIALSDSDQIWRELFLYRFENGDFQGHNFGNIFLTVLEKLTQSFEKSIELAQTVLKTRGNVIPVTLEKTHINAKLVDGSIVKTEALIDEKVKRAPIAKLFFNHRAKVNPKAIYHLKRADLIIVAPGDLYTSILPLFTFKEIVRYFKNSKAKKAMILNLMNKLGQTDDFTAVDFLKRYEKSLGADPFDYVIANNATVSPDIAKHYTTFGENEVINDLVSTDKLQVLEGNLISSTAYQKNRGDKLSRSVLRHDSTKLAKFIWEQVISKS